MSFVVGDIAGLRTWTQEEILWRESAVQRIKNALESAMLEQNQAWRFERIEAPFIVPLDSISASYDADDIFGLTTDIGNRKWALRAETTAGSYAAAVKMLRDTKTVTPLCVWQAGQSFRTEKSDGATAAKLRFNQFWQLEFQMIYRADSHADIPGHARNAAAVEIARVLGKPIRIVPSDRLPSYSTSTIDIEAPWHGGFIEVASTSERTDFPHYNGAKPMKVFEVAIGLDRLIHVAQGNI